MRSNETQIRTACHEDFLGSPNPPFTYALLVPSSRLCVVGTNPHTVIITNMKRHSDPKAILKERPSGKTLRWGGGGRTQTGSQPSAAQNLDDPGQTSNSGAGSPLQLPASAAGVVGVLPRSPGTATGSPQAPEEETVRALLDSGGDRKGTPYSTANWCFMAPKTTSADMVQPHEVVGRSFGLIEQSN